MSDLHDRIAKALGWSTRDVQSLSMQSLRDLVRPVDPRLAQEMDYVIQSGTYVRGAPATTKGRRSHATTKRDVPGVAKWSMTAGGTGAAKGKHGYTFTVPQGTYHIWPFTTKLGRHAGYSLRFSATGGRPRGSHGGLWHDLGTHRSPQSAASAAGKHHAGGFE